MSRAAAVYAVWILLGAPLVLLTVNYAAGTALLTGPVFYGGYVHDTGRLAAWLLLLVLALTPLRLSFPGNGLLRRLAAQRRYLGVASFAYAAAHLAAYVLRQPFDIVMEDFVTAAFWTGWLAFAIFLALAATSNDLSLRLLRRGWKTLHRLAHPAAALTLVHWALTAFDPFLAWCHVGALAVIEAWRMLKVHTRRPTRA